MHGPDPSLLVHGPAPSLSVHPSATPLSVHPSDPHGYTAPRPDGGPVVRAAEPLRRQYGCTPTGAAGGGP
ncbi:hypothetical protein JOC24_002597 [Streptomyces sp. HB132]|nr:hypothetical protein [Streptomyces sp. HB132]